MPYLLPSCSCSVDSQNPNTSEESKEHSRQVLSEHGVEAEA